MNAITCAAPLIGRLLLAVLFIKAGYDKIWTFDGTAAYIASTGLPLAQLGAGIAILVELGGGLMLAAGWRARWAAAALIVFTLVATVIFHAFWAVPEDQVRGQTIHFMKNLSIIGGLFYVLAHGSGAFSLDGRRS